ncbi:MAG: DNA primase [Rhodospirillaceae bacterium]|nr:DNA primase [Rhodospirillaceae bacterium]
MATFTPQFLDEIRARIPVSSVVGKRVKLIRRGREYIGLSPFSNEKSPSFTVSDEKGFYHCFSTQEHGDIFTFLMKTQNLSFPEAVERLAEEAGVEMPRQTREEVQEAARVTLLQQAADAGCGVFEEALRGPEGRRALAYLRESRGLTEETIKRFRLGYAPQGNAVKSKLTARGVKEDLLLETRLVSPGKDGRESFDFFRDRVMFPIMDARGRPVAFGGRVMGEGEPKYLNSPDTPLFHKGQMLYGLSLAREKASADREIIVAEGYMDVIALAQAGFTNAVAPLGTALTETQIALLWRFAPEPILCFDGDKAGRAAALRAADRALPVLKPGFSLRFAIMAGGKDPDEICRRQGPEAMAEVLAGALPLSEVVWNQLLAEHPTDTPERRAGFEAHAMAKAGQIEDETVRSQYRQMFKNKLYELFRPERPAAPGRTGQGKAFRGSKAGSKFPRGASFPQVFPRPAAVSEDARSQTARALRERILLATALNHPEIIERVEERLGALMFSDARLDSLRQSALLHLAQTQELDFATLRAQLASQGFAQELANLLDSDIYVHAGFAKPLVAAAQALAGWDHTYALIQRTDLEADLKRAEQDLAENPSEQTFAALKALREQTGPAEDDDQDPGHP